MSGDEIIIRLKKVKELIKENNIKQAQLNINYIIDDIFMYKNNSL
jgi:hypothetical protein|tara:strand:- start:390 stop:524 length:135 start_codon:yes stop_codon:yes gene_type:complete